MLTFFKVWPFCFCGVLVGGGVYVGSKIYSLEIKEQQMLLDSLDEFDRENDTVQQKIVGLLSQFIDIDNPSHVEFSQLILTTDESEYDINFLKKTDKRKRRRNTYINNAINNFRIYDSIKPVNTNSDLYNLPVPVSYNNALFLPSIKNNKDKLIPKKWDSIEVVTEDVRDFSVENDNRILWGKYPIVIMKYTNNNNNTENEMYKNMWSEMTNFNNPGKKPVNHAFDTSKKYTYLMFKVHPQFKDTRNKHVLDSSDKNAPETSNVSKDYWQWKAKKDDSVSPLISESVGNTYDVFQEIKTITSIT